MHKPLLPALTIPGLLSLVLSLFFATSLSAQTCADCTLDDDTMRSFLTEAEKGNPLAMTWIALRFFRKENEAEGKSWLQKAMDANEPGALKIVADMYADGLGDYPKDRKRALDLYRQALAATTRAQAEKSGSYPPRYLLALKAELSGILGEAAASGEKGMRDVPKAARLFAEAELYPQLARLLISHPELDFPLDSLSPESLRELVSELEYLFFQRKESSREDRLVAMHLLAKLYEEDSTGVHLVAQPRQRWERSLMYTMDETAKARLMKKLQTVKSEVQTRTASGWYSSDKVDVFLLDNGLFLYSLALGIAGRGYQFSWNGTWKEAAKDQVCLTMSPPEIVLFGRLNTEKALDPEQLMRDVIHLNMDEHSKKYSANIFLSRKAGAREELPEDFARFGSYWDDSVNWTDYRGGISEHMKADTSFLWSALLDETDLSNKSQMRVYRHALDPRYNDYVLRVKNPGLTGFSHEDDFPEDMIASAMLLMALLKKDTVKVQGTSLCGVMDDKRLERHEFSLEDRIYYEKMLEANERLPRIWQNGKSWMRIPAEDLGLRTLNIPESAD